MGEQVGVVRRAVREAAGQQIAQDVFGFDG